ncbi:N-acetylmuramoyl-L-alanine amidase [Actinomyces sp. W5033]|uniref:N-acetylmuramoyl-L-alanine amidase n=1 Tax=Actinomyces sp. W5033 TaxID=3446479 RepID=UPI003EDFEB10
MTAVQAEAASAGPVQVIELTTASGQATELAEAGLDEQAQGDSRAPAGTSGGTGVVPGLDVALADALAVLAGTIDPEADATLLTEPLEVAGFLVAGFTWTGAATLPEGTQIYLRVRENGVWTDWYLNEPSDAGRDDRDPATAVSGTDEFVTGGADAIQVAVIAGPSGLPADLALSLVPGEPAGEEVLQREEMTVVDAERTGVAEEQAQASGVPSPAAEPVQPEGAAPVDTSPSVTVPHRSAVPAGTSAGTGVSPSLPALLAAATTANGLPVAVTTRAEWGANPAYLDWDPEYAAASHVVVHHTAGTNDYTEAQAPGIVRGIYYYHARTRDWGDIGYNFLVDKYGNVYEGRYGTLSSAPGTMVVAGHAYGANTGTMGISMMGTYTSVSPSEAQLQSVGKIAGWFLARAGVADATASAPFTIKATEKYRAGQVVTLPRVLAHRDVGYTTCPGDVGYSLMGTIRAIAQTQVTNGSSALTRTWQRSGSSWKLIEAGKALTGWQRVDGAWYYLGADGLMRTGWQPVDGSWYYLSSSGAMVTGWLQQGGSWYYLSASGAMVTGWLQQGGSWYYLSASGAMVTGWLQQGGSWYYLSASGAMVTGWLQQGGSWYYLSASGAMVTGWLQQGGSWYYLSASGAMVTGWLQQGGSWYYLDSSGAMRTGWQQVGGVWYYLDSSGAMVTGARQIDGTWNLFSASGAWQGYTTLTPVMAAPSASRGTVLHRMVTAYQATGHRFPSQALSAGGAGTLWAFATLVYDEATAEGVSPELLFAQVMTETAWLQFGGDVSISQFNFGGLGATGNGNRGLSFPDVRTGLRAQVQHLRAYADPSVTTASLAHPVVDPRFGYVRKGSAPYVEHLGIQENPAGTGWAASRGYGLALASLMQSLG